MDTRAPIGIFDSGLGGLSVAREIRRLVPAESLLYVADSRFCPYGSRTSDEIAWRSRLIAGALIDAGAKLLVIACNTATAVALEELRATFSLPIIGLEPAVKPAVARSRSHAVGVLATPKTASSERLARLVTRFASDGSTVRIVPAPGLVELVETGATSGPSALETARAYVDPLVDAGVDTIVLGCTHYPFLRELLQEVAGESVEIIDSGAAIARRTEAVLSLEGLHTTAGDGSLEILTTGEINVVRDVARRLLDEPARVRHLSLPHEEALSPKCSEACTSSTSAFA